MLNRILNSLSSIFTVIAAVMVVVSVGFGSLILGYMTGFNEGVFQTQTKFEEILEANNLLVSSTEESEPEVVTKTVYVTPKPYSPPTWGGPELWEAVNKRRKELGVNSLDQRAEICTIASIRLNELLELGKLDGHEGFSTLPERREDLVWIFEKYNLSEFLVSGANSAQDAVNLWENTLGHKKLLTGGEYVWGCIYAQAGFGVAITAY
jgi:hypothetical protein